MTAQAPLPRRTPVSDRTATAARRRRIVAHARTRVTWATDPATLRRLADGLRAVRS